MNRSESYILYLSVLMVIITLTQLMFIYIPGSTALTSNRLNNTPLISFTEMVQTTIFYGIEGIYMFI